MGIMETMDRLDNVLKSIFMTIPKILNEKQKKILSRCIAQGYGFSGIKIVSGLSELDVETIRAGIRKIKAL